MFGIAGLVKEDSSFKYLFRKGTKVGLIKYFINTSLTNTSLSFL